MGELRVSGERVFVRANKPSPDFVGSSLYENPQNLDKLGSGNPYHTGAFVFV